MYAIVKIADKQFKVQEGKYIYVPKLDAKQEDVLSFKHVLLKDDGQDIHIGNPFLENMIVQCKVLDQVKGDKVLVFKKKRRKGYKKKQGHRQQYTKLLIEKIAKQQNS